MITQKSLLYAMTEISKSTLSMGNILKFEFLLTVGIWPITMQIAIYFHVEVVMKYTD